MTSDKSAEMLSGGDVGDNISHYDEETRDKILTRMFKKTRSVFTGDNNKTFQLLWYEFMKLYNVNAIQNLEVLPSPKEIMESKVNIHKTKEDDQEPSEVPFKTPSIFFTGDVLCAVIDHVKRLDGRNAANDKIANYSELLENAKQHLTPFAFDLPSVVKINEKYMEPWGTLTVNENELELVHTVFGNKDNIEDSLVLLK